MPVFEDRDIQIAHQLERRISRYGYGAGGIEIQFEKGLAIIMGRVSDGKDKIEVEKIVREDKRVKKIENCLSVFEEPDSMFYRRRI